MGQAEVGNVIRVLWLQAEGGQIQVVKRVKMPMYSVSSGLQAEGGKIQFKLSMFTSPSCRQKMARFKLMMFFASSGCRQKLVRAKLTILVLPAAASALFFTTKANKKVEEK